MFWTGQSEETFRSPSQTVHLPILRLLKASHCLFLLPKVKYSILNFIFFGLIRPGIKSKSIVSVEAALSTLHWSIIAQSNTTADRENLQKLAVICSLVLMDEASATKTVDLSSLRGRYKPCLSLVLTLILRCVHCIQWDSVTVKHPPV